MPLTVPADDRAEDAPKHTIPDNDEHSDGMGLLSPEGPATDAEEEAFIRAMQRRKKKKKRRGLGM